MTTVSSSLIVRLVDGVSGPARAAAAAVRSIGSAVTALSGARATINLGRTVGRELNRVGQATQQVASTISGPLALAGAIGARQAFEFEKAGNMLEALGDATRQQRAQFERFANDLNAEFPQSLAEIIRTGNEMLKAGFNFEQMRGAIRQTLATAILGEMRPSEVAAIMSGAMNGFQMPMETFEQAVRSSQLVSDRMTFAAVRTTASLRDMGEMFKYVGAAAAATGTDLDNVTAFAMAFARNRIVGSDAGVALRSAIIRLVRPTRGGLAAMERIGMNVNDYVTGGQRITTDRILGGLRAGGLGEAGEAIRGQIEALLQDPGLANAPIRLASMITARLQEHLRNTGSAVDAAQISENVQESLVAAGNRVDLMRFFSDLQQRIANGTANMGDVSRILEGRHFARYQALLQANFPDLLRSIREGAEGFTIARYQIANQGIVGAFRELTSALEQVSVAFGRAVFPQLVTAFKQMSDGLQRISETNPALLRLATYAGLALVAVAPLGLALIGAQAAFTAIAGAATAAGAAILAAFTPIGAVVVAAVAALTAVGVFIVNNFAGVVEAVQGFGAGFMAAIEPIRPLTDGVVATISALTSQIIALTGPLAATSAEWRAWGEAAGRFTGQTIVAAVNLVRLTIQALQSDISAIAVWFAALPGRIQAAIDDVVARVTAWGQRIAAAVMEGAEALYQAGVSMVQRLWDGMLAKFHEFIGWVRSIPSMIVQAIGSIDLSNIIRWPSRPSWLGGAAGGAGSGSGAAPSGPTATVPARERGGRLDPNTPTLVGERGPELVTASRPGWVSTALQTSRMLGAGSGLGGRSPRGAFTFAPQVSFSVHAAGGDIRGALNEFSRKLAEDAVRAWDASFSDQEYA